MKLMDKNGRLFGKISVIDVVVVLVVLVMAAALYVKNTSLSHTSTRVTNTSITYQVTAYNVRQYVADAVQEGDLVYDQDYSTGGTLGAIQSIEVQPSGKLTELYDGTVVSAPAQDSVNLVLTIQGEGLISEGRYQLNRIYDLGINASRNFYTPYAQFTGTVTSIG